MKTTLRLLPLPMILALGWFVAADPEPAPQPPAKDASSPKEKQPMPAIPPIDAAAPAKFETATFALG